MNTNSYLSTAIKETGFRWRMECKSIQITREEWSLPESNFHRRPQISATTPKLISLIAISQVGFEVAGVLHSGYVQRKAVNIKCACLKSVARLLFTEDSSCVVLAHNWWLERHALTYTLFLFSHVFLTVKAPVYFNLAEIDWNNEKNSLILSAIYGVEKLLQLLGGQDPISKVSIELIKGQLAIIWKKEGKEESLLHRQNNKPARLLSFVLTPFLTVMWQRPPITSLRHEHNLTSTHAPVTIT